MRAALNIFFEHFYVFGHNFPFAALYFVRNLLHELVEPCGSADARAVALYNAVHEVGFAHAPRL